MKSNVSIEVFDSFIKYLLKKETPNINSNNFFEYEELSKEFDFMKDIIQLHQQFLPSIKKKANYQDAQRSCKLQITTITRRLSNKHSFIIKIWPL